MKDITLFMFIDGDVQSGYEDELFISVGVTDNLDKTILEYKKYNPKIRLHSSAICNRRHGLKFKRLTEKWLHEHYADIVPCTDNNWLVTDSARIKWMLLEYGISAIPEFKGLNVKIY